MPNVQGIVSRVLSGKLVGPIAGAMLCVVATLALDAWATLPNLHWYASLRRPSFRPPDLVLALSWIMVHCTMLWMFIRVLRSPDWMPDRSAALQSFFVQLAIHAVWPIAVFGLHRPKLGLVVGGALIVQLLWATRVSGRVDRRAGTLTLPALAWTIYAVLLNLSVAIRN